MPLSHVLDCAEVLKRSAKLNNEERIQVFEFAVDDKGEGDIYFT